MKLLTLALILAALPLRALALSLPDPDLTPGSTLTVPKAVLCKPGYTQRVRNVPLSQKKRICAAYKAKDCPGPKWEIDHLISLTLGGSNSDLNLFSQPIEEARRKDVIELRLHREVCSGKTTIKDAQRRIKEWWKEK